jgi:hypothetical protein
LDNGAKSGGYMWTIPTTNEINEDMTSSTRATVDFGSSTNRSSANFENNNDQPYQQHLPQQRPTRMGQGGLAFDYILNDNNNNNNHDPNLSFRSLQSSSTDASSKFDTKSSTLTDMTLTKRFELRKTTLARKRSSDLDTSLSATSSLTASKVTNSNVTQISLGAKIQERARQNASSPKLGGELMVRRASENGLGGLTPATSSSSNTPMQYSNKTLHLRQEAARAKLEKPQTRDRLSSHKQQPTNGIIHLDYA